MAKLCTYSNGSKASANDNGISKLILTVPPNPTLAPA